MIRNAARALLAVLFAVCIYRAVTQSITHDEAFTWELYLYPPLSAIFHNFTANLHFLSAILMRVSTAMFGTSEFSMRLPSLIGAALYFAAIDRLAGFFRNPWMHLMATALMCLNPFILDFMVAARGYGLALALWMWALALIAEQDPKRAALAGTALGLSITANLVFLPPAAALAAMGIWLFAQRAPVPETTRRKKKGAAEPKTLAPWIRFIAPVVGITLAFFLVAPFENANLRDFYTGVDTIAESLRSLALVSLRHSGPFRFASWNLTWSDVTAFGIAPVIAIAGLVLAWRRRDVLMSLVSGTIAISVLGLIVLHGLLDRPYPSDRTGIYFLPLVALVLALLADREKYIAIPACALGLVFIVQFATEFNVRRFLIWEYDADTRSIAQALADHRDRNASTVRVGSSWTLSKALYFYATKNGWIWLELTNRPVPGADFNALVADDRAQEPDLGVVEIYEGPVSHSVLTIRR